VPLPRIVVVRSREERQSWLDREALLRSRRRAHSTKPAPAAATASCRRGCLGFSRSSHVRCQPLTRAPVSPLSAASAASLRIAGMRMIWMRSRARGPPTVCNVHLKYDGLAGSPNATAGIEQPVWDWTKGKFTYPSPRRLPTPKAKSMRSIRRRGRSLGSS
jgi:hypothetical protein